MIRQEIEQRTLSFVERIEHVEAGADARGLFQDYIEALGFSRATCMKIPEAGEEAADCIMLSTFPDEWMRHYGEQGYVKTDPVVRELYQTQHAYSWSEVLGRRAITPQQQLIFREASDFGMTEGFVVPIYEATGYTGLVSIAGEKVEVREDMRNALTLSSIYLHNRLCALRRVENNARYDLSDRERDCLSWAAAGKSDWEIGQILTISAKTVNYHIENAKRKFGVATRVQAIVAAMRHGRLVH